MKFRNIVSSLFLLIFFSFNFENAHSQTCRWAEKIGGTGQDSTCRTVVDDNGNVYVAGTFRSSTCDFNNGISLKNNGGSDTYLAKYNASGICQWAQKISGTGEDYAKSIAVDASGNVYIAGYFESAILSFNNNVSLDLTKYTDAFIAQYNSNGICQWAQKISGTNNEFAYDITVDIGGNVYVVGAFGCTTLSFNNNIALFLSGEIGSADAYIAKYNSSGTCQWAKRIAGSSDDNAACIAVDAIGNIYVAGEFISGTLNFNNGLSLTNSGLTDAFVAKYNSNGVCQWAQKIAGKGVDGARGIAIDVSGSVFVVGFFDSEKLDYNNGFLLDHYGAMDGFIVKFNKDGLYQWARKIYGTGNDNALGIALDKGSNVYIAGFFESKALCFNIVEDYKGISIENSGTIRTADAFIAKYNANGDIQGTQKIVGSNDDYANSISVDGKGNTYIAGQFMSSNLGFNNGISLTNSGISNGYIAKYGPLVLMDAPTLSSPADSLTDVSVLPSLAWNAVPYAKSYRINISYDSLCRFEFATDQIVTGEAFTPSANLFYNTQCYWRVKVESDTGSGYWSKTCSFKTVNGVAGPAPNCEWTQIIGGKGSESPGNSAVDSAGNIYATGTFSSDTLVFNSDISLTNVTAGTTGTYADVDVYIAKYNSSGICQWAQKIVSSKEDNISGIVTDALGNIIVSGYFKGKTLSFNDGISLTNSGDKDSNFNCYIAKYNSNGTCLWAKKIAGDVIALDDVGSFFVTGVDSSVIVANSSPISKNLFVAKYYSNGNIEWLQKIIGTISKYSNYINSIVVDGLGNEFIAGYFNSDTLSLNNGISLISSNGDASSWDGFIAKYNSSGVCQWAERIGGTSTIVDNLSIKKDYLGNIYVVGNLWAAYDYDSLSFNNGIFLTLSQAHQGFISKYNSGGICQWAQIISGNWTAEISNIAVDAIGNVYVSGSGVGISYSLIGSNKIYDFPTLSFNNGISLYNCDTTTWSDGYIAKYNSSGLCQWAHIIKNRGSVAVGSENNIYISSYFSIRRVNSKGETYGDYDISLSKFSYNTNGIVENIIEANSLIIRPNPAREYIEILLGSEDQNIDVILIYNELGLLVVSLNSNQLNGTNSTNKIRINQLPSGLYNLVVKTNNEIMNKPFLIIK